MRTTRTMLTALAVAGAAAVVTLPAATTAQADGRVRANSGACNYAKMTRPAIVLKDDGNLYCFDATNPDGARLLRKNPLATPSTTDTDPRLLGIDFRVTDGKLWGLGTNGNLYKIKPQDGALDGSAVALTSTTPSTLPIGSTEIGFDFNPTNGALRIVTTAGRNLRVGDPATGVTIADTALAPGTTGVTAVAYSNNDKEGTVSPARTGTTLFDLDTNPTAPAQAPATPDQVFVQAPPNAGTLQLTGNLGVDTNAPAAMDIYTSLKNGTADVNTTYLVINPVNDAQYSDLYRLDPLTGNATLVGLFPEIVGRTIGVAVFL